MPNLDVETFRRGYEAMNAAYRGGDVNEFRPVLEESFDPDMVLQPGGVLPDSEQRPHRGYEGFLNFIANQMEAFSDMWVRPEEFIEVGDLVVIPSKLHATGRSTGIEASQSAVQVWELRDGKALRVDFFSTREQALAYAREKTNT